MTNGHIIDILENTAALMELHDENPFKVKAVQSAVFNLEKISDPLGVMTLEELNKLDGVGKGIAAKINEINQTGTTEEYQTYLNNTPVGVISMIGIKGVGPKKVRTLWKELQVESLEALRQACIDQRVAAVKGFGEKTPLGRPGQPAARNAGAVAIPGRHGARLPVRARNGAQAWPRRRLPQRQPVGLQHLDPAAAAAPHVDHSPGELRRSRAQDGPDPGGHSPAVAGPQAMPYANWLDTRVVSVH